MTSVHKQKQIEAKKEPYDEFYTLYENIELEINAYLAFNKDVFKNKTILLPCDDPDWSEFTKYFAQNFEKLGLKKLISTSIAPDCKKNSYSTQLSFLDEKKSPKYDAKKSETKGKIFTLDHDTNKNGKVDIEDLEWDYLQGTGDFQSDEVAKLRDEADIIVTNPPFSLFKKFIPWVTDSGKQFIAIGHVMDATYKEIARLIIQQKMWVGATNYNKGMFFRVPDDFTYANTYKFPKELNGIKVNRVGGICWYTNIDHGRRHEPLQLLTEKENIKHSCRKEVKNIGYKKYDNYDAIEVKYVETIPSDYDGVIGVPPTFLDKFCNSQFELLGMAASAGYDPEIVGIPFLGEKDARPTVDGTVKNARYFIKRRR